MKAVFVLEIFLIKGATVVHSATSHSPPQCTVVLLTGTSVEDMTDSSHQLKPETTVG